MTKDQVRDAILRLVIETFLRDWKPTTRKRLIVEFRDSPVVEELLNELDQNRLLVRDSRGSFLPSAVAFHLAAGREQLQLARNSFRIVAEAMRALYLENADEQTSFSREAVLKRMQELDPTASDDTLNLGFYFVQEFQLSGGYASDQSGKIENFYVPDRLALKKDFEAEWDRGMKRNIPQPREPVPANFSFPQLSIADAEVSWVRGEQEHDESACLDLDAEWIHPRVREIACTRTQNLADAVEACLKEFCSRVRRIVKGQTGKEYDGTDLMQRAFSLDSPVLRLGDLDTMDGRNMQKGYMQIFSGAMTGIRNPKAHSNIEITPKRAMQFLALASLMMEKLDEAAKNAEAQESVTDIARTDKR